MEKNKWNQKYINSKCSKCEYWDEIYQCCGVITDENMIDNGVDFWQLCEKDDQYVTSDERYYHMIIRDNTKYYNERVRGEF